MIELYVILKNTKHQYYTEHVYYFIRYLHLHLLNYVHNTLHLVYIDSLESKDSAYVDWFG
jgi:hypothetical protein